ncbi:MAG TPA: GAF domain-containing protein [Nitrospirota bacterium]|nr:GAF domain-containing protein [Nitrospirota bacterium]
MDRDTEGLGQIRDHYEREIVRLKDRLERYESLEAAQLLLVSEPDTDRLIELVAETAARLLDAETVAVPILSQDNLQVRYGHACGKNRDVFLGIVLPIEDSGLCGWSLDNRISILCPDLMRDPRVKKDLVKALGYSSAALAPLIARGRIIGGLSAFDKKDGTAFNQEDISVLTRFANYASIIIDNSRLMRELERERAKLDAIFDGVSDGIVFLSGDGTIVNANRAVEKYFPMKAADMVGTRVQEFDALKKLEKVFDWNAKAPENKRCWEVHGCKNAACPVYGKDVLRCWSFSRGHCRFPGRERCSDKKVWEHCSRCRLLKEASATLAAPREVGIMGKTIQASSTIIIEDGAKGVFGELVVFHEKKDPA